MEGQQMSVRIGVYICHCGSNIAGKVDVIAVSNFAKQLPNVIISRTYQYMCSEPGQDFIINDIKDHQLNRIVVAACSPLMHEKTFRSALNSAGLNSFLLQVANIREQCSWVIQDSEKATEKAKVLVSGSVGRVRFLIPLKQSYVTVNKSILVIGGGIAGIQAALQCGDTGYKVYLVERNSTIGGHMAMLDKTFPTLDCAACILTPKMAQVGQHPNIELLTLSEVQELKGTAGNFKVKIKKKPRYVTDECTGCGECEIFCPIINKPQIQPLPEYSKQIETEEVEKLNKIINKYSSVNPGVPGENMLIQILQDISVEYNYLPEYSLKYVSEVLRIPLSRIYHIATFYTAFSLTPIGEHLIKVCMGTACYARGATNILDRIETILDIKPDETTEDGKFTLQTVGCLGCCALGPVVVADGNYHQMTISKVDKLIDHYYKKEKEHARI